jgi:beta-glucosidase/6-phospho-beta-glucosidase/beta-galactosidase
MQFQLGWMADPLYFGDYPAVMRASQPHLPKFKDAEKKLLVGSLDFFALNYYTSHFVAAAPPGAPKAQVLLAVLVMHSVSNCTHMPVLYT